MATEATVGFKLMWVGTYPYPFVRLGVGEVAPTPDFIPYTRSTYLEVQVSDTPSEVTLPHCVPIVSTNMCNEHKLPLPSS
eukprot:756575-Hanusia_phi.AAC.1